MTMNRREEDNNLVRRQIGQNVAVRRAELDLSQAECARRAAVSVSEIAALEAGDRQPTASTLKKIAAALEWESSNIVAGVRWVMPGDHHNGRIEQEGRHR